MSPYTLTPFVLEAIEKALPGTSPLPAYTTSKKISVIAGTLYLRVFPKEAPNGLFSGQELVDHLRKGKNLFLVNPGLHEGLLFLYLWPLPFSQIPEVLDWPTLTLAAASKVHLPAYALGGGL